MPPPLVTNILLSVRSDLEALPGPRHSPAPFSGSVAEGYENVADPWRKTSDPYHILVPEVMLQQTQVDRVIPKYHEFVTATQAEELA